MSPQDTPVCLCSKSKSNVVAKSAPERACNAALLHCAGLSTAALAPTCCSSGPPQTLLLA